ncbi:MAG: hypothetical protein M9924_21185 [Rhizobiaceae bacterium]|nr:hypothetical protein [Rhizobiaceae bacterium]
MTYYMATIEILVDVDDDSEACDCIAETLRPQLREFSPGSPVIDWRYSSSAFHPTRHDGSGFEYALPQQDDHDHEI